MSKEPIKLLSPMTVEEINRMTARARELPPSGDQTHVLVADGEDPWVVSHQGSFYYCTVDRAKKKILISKFERLTEMATAQLIEVYPTGLTDIPDYIEIWSPELQFLDNKWYVYFALYNGNNNQERMHVIEALTGDPQGEYGYKGKINVKTDRWAIDGTVLEIPKAGRYFIWSGWDGHINESQNIYIAEMSNPWTVVSDRVCISRPEHDWEKNGYPYVNEGPQALIHEDRVFIIYSASGSWTDDYCLGQLTFLGGNPLDPRLWRKEPQPVFQKTDSIFGPGHCSFVKDEKGKDWMIYHAARSSGAGWARQIRAKPYVWNAAGAPNFGKPI